jgi:protoporphyrinogen oxidase
MQGVQEVDFLVVGAGMSGLSFACAIRDEAKKRGAALPSVRIVEKDTEPGGYCKTVKQDGFVWDYSGHFFHFKHPEIESWLKARMGDQVIRTVEKKSFIRYRGQDIDFPFQKNIHQLDKAEFIECLTDLYFKDEDQTDAPAGSFKEMVYRRLGKGISEKFLIPYNEKLYACDLGELDQEAMGRFFPKADTADIIRNMRKADNTSYNASFTYPEGGAIEYVKAFLGELPDEVISYGEKLEGINLARQTATTTAGKYRFKHLISSAPFNRQVEMCGLAYEEDAFSWNKVLVFNLGFDKKGPDGVHWIYFPDRNLRFYRVGFYDNILGADRMSLYVEIGARDDENLDVEVERQRVLDDLKKESIVTDHELVSWHTVTMNPAYVHINQRALKEFDRLKAHMTERGVHPVGRYGGWTYCSIEDNILETRALAETLAEEWDQGGAS